MRRLKCRGAAWFAALAVAVVMALSIGGVAFALSARSSGIVENSFGNGTVSTQVIEQFDGHMKSSIAVANTGNVPVYCRVRLVAYWVDADGEPVGKAAPELDVALAEGWVSDASGAYFCTQPVAAGESTPNMLATPIDLTVDGEYREVIEVLTESIQANPTNAVEEAWGVV